MEQAKKEQDHAKDQAAAQLDSIKEMTSKLKKAEDYGTDEEIDNAQAAIHQDALSVEVRSNWHAIGEAQTENEEFRILLCTGGPAVHIVGTLDRFNQPASVRLQYQDWGTPWTDYPLSLDDETCLRHYAQQFYYGE